MGSGAKKPPRQRAPRRCVWCRRRRRGDAGACRRRGARAGPRRGPRRRRRTRRASADDAASQSSTGLKKKKRRKKKPAVPRLRLAHAKMVRAPRLAPPGSRFEVPSAPSSAHCTTSHRAGAILRAPCCFARRLIHLPPNVLRGLPAAAAAACWAARRDPPPCLPAAPLGILSRRQSPTPCAVDPRTAPKLPLTSPPSSALTAAAPTACAPCSSVARAPHCCSTPCLRRHPGF